MVGRRESLVPRDKAHPVWRGCSFIHAFPSSYGLVVHYVTSTSPYPSKNVRGTDALQSRFSIAPRSYLELRPRGQKTSIFHPFHLRDTFSKMQRKHPLIPAGSHNIATSQVQVSYIGTDCWNPRPHSIIFQRDRPRFPALFLSLILSWFNLLRGGLRSFGLSLIWYVDASVLCNRWPCDQRGSSLPRFVVRVHDFCPVLHRAQHYLPVVP